jgi:hypothetical protein
MRELKFRVWDLEKKFYLNQDDEFHFYEPDRGWQCPIPLCECLRDKRRYVVQQYTGIKDKYNQPIYEGDVIRGIFDFGPAGFKEEILPVVWHNERGYQWDYWNLSTIEVLGNLNEWPCRKPGSFDNNGECLTCDGWATDCPFLKFCPSPKFIIK